ncbi:MAG: hypothetical protein K9N51_02360 [Candidatus Pacebacteria bacterium]|nr:hypothetical protein [Candidatus Paceibacterota bacterium]
MAFKRKDGKAAKSAKNAQQFHTVRSKDGGTVKLRYGRKLAIYLTCVECCGFEEHPQGCTSPLCPLFPFRGSTRASHKGDK